jgi:hypothetical protein
MLCYRRLVVRQVVVCSLQSVLHSRRFFLLEECIGSARACRCRALLLLVALLPLLPLSSDPPSSGFQTCKGIRGLGVRRRAWRRFLCAALARDALQPLCAFSLIVSCRNLICSSSCSSRVSSNSEVERRTYSCSSARSRAANRFSCCCICACMLARRARTAGVVHTPEQSRDCVV